MDGTHLQIVPTSADTLCVYTPPPFKIYSCRMEELGLLSKLEDLKLLSKLEASGLTLSKIEQSGLLGKAEKSGVLSLIADK